MMVEPSQHLQCNRGIKQVKSDGPNGNVNPVLCSPHCRSVLGTSVPQDQGRVRVPWSVDARCLLSGEEEWRLTELYSQMSCFDQL